MSPSVTYTVIIPTLNEEKYLPQVLDSLARQTLQNFEVIVVDGKSRDKTVEVAHSRESTLSLTVLKAEKASLPYQRNLGAKHALGSWLIFVDADSVLLSHFFERITEYIREKAPVIFTTWFRPDSDEAKDAIVTTIVNTSLDGSILLHRPFSPGPLTIIKKSAFDMVGGYDESRTFTEDADLSMRLHARGIELSILHETLCVLSLRRFRKEGLFRVLRKYSQAAVSFLLLKRAPKSMRGYTMGGQVYGKQMKKRSIIKTYKRKLSDHVRDLF